MTGVRTTPCRDCGAPIAFGVGNKGGFVPCEPGSLAEHVCDGKGRIVFEPRLGHRRHECAPRKSATTPVATSGSAAPTPTEGKLDAADWLDGLPGGTPLDDLRRSLEHARFQIGETLRWLDKMAGR
jgi:hypothetical protein